MNKAKRECLELGCHELTTGSRCEKHTRKAWQGANEFRGTLVERGYDNQWRKARDRYIASNPLCAECKRQGKIQVGYSVDHIIPHRGNQVLFWDTNNWQTLCRYHHSKKTSEENAADKRAMKAKYNKRLRGMQ